MSESRKPFDFDEWAKLARENPEAFEKRRQEEVEALITSAPKHLQGKLRKLQWRIDAERARCKTPYQAALKLNQMLMDSYLGEYGLAQAILELDRMLNGTVHNFSPIPAPKRDADVLVLHRKKND